MKDFSKEERQRVIDLYADKLKRDIELGNEVAQALGVIAQYHVDTGRSIALECWCAPDACHGDLMIPVLEDMIKELKK